MVMPMCSWLGIRDCTDLGRFVCCFLGLAPKSSELHLNKNSGKDMYILPSRVSAASPPQEGQQRRYNGVLAYEHASIAGSGVQVQQRTSTANESNCSRVLLPGLHSIAMPCLHQNKTHRNKWIKRRV